MSKSSFDAHLKDYFDDGIDETKLTNHSEVGLADRFHDQRVKVFSFDSDLIPIQHILKLKESSKIDDYYNILTDLSQVLEEDDQIIILLSLTQGRFSDDCDFMCEVYLKLLPFLQNQNPLFILSILQQFLFFLKRFKGDHEKLKRLFISFFKTSFFDYILIFQSNYLFFNLFFTSLDILFYFEELSESNYLFSKTYIDKLADFKSLYFSSLPFQDSSNRAFVVFSSISYFDRLNKANFYSIPSQEKIYSTLMHIHKKGYAQFVFLSPDLLYSPSYFYALFLHRLLPEHFYFMPTGLSSFHYFLLIQKFYFYFQKSDLLKIPSLLLRLSSSLLYVRLEFKLNTYSLFSPSSLINSFKSVSLSDLNDHCCSQFLSVIKKYPEGRLYLSYSSALFLKRFLPLSFFNSISFKSLHFKDDDLGLDHIQFVFVTPDIIA